MWFWPILMGLEPRQSILGSAFDMDGLHYVTESIVKRIKQYGASRSGGVLFENLKQLTERPFTPPSVTLSQSQHCQQCFPFETQLTGMISK